jgi:hypothetical protein
LLPKTGNAESGEPEMRTSSEYDRLSTQEELHQVLDILGDLDRVDWLLSEVSPSRQANDEWADALVGNSDDAALLAEAIKKTSELKN